MPKKIAIVGGGVTGLAAAFTLERHTDAEIDLYEAASKLGGKIGTERIGDLLIETGPDCFFARKPGVKEFVCELGLEDELIEPVQKEFSILSHGKLHRVPSGLASFTGLRPEAIDEATFLSEEAKERVKEESRQLVGGGEDESITSFFTRRFGPDFTRLLAEPLLAGTHGGDPARLSMKALYPAYIELERRQGSLSGVAGSTPGGQGSATFLSFRNGMQTLIDALVGGLGRTRLHLEHALDSVEELEGDRVLLAVPANRAAPLIARRSPGVAILIAAIEHRSSAVVTLSLARTSVKHPMDGTGFLIPPSEPSAVTGATWSSSKWTNRAPVDAVLIRVFLGGDRSALLKRSDPELVREALDGISGVMGIHDVPSEVRVVRWIDALPQYELGHLDRIAAIEAALEFDPTLVIAGTSYRGVGIPDCLRQGREAASKLMETL